MPSTAVLIELGFTEPVLHSIGVIRRLKDDTSTEVINKSVKALMQMRAWSRWRRVFLLESAGFVRPALMEVAYIPRAQQEQAMKFVRFNMSKANNKAMVRILRKHRGLMPEDVVHFAVDQYLRIITAQEDGGGIYTRFLLVERPYQFK
jgi:hypothetical protein